MWNVGILDDFLASGRRRPLVRLVDSGTASAPGSYTSAVRLGGHDFDDVVDPHLVAARFAEGATVVAQSLHRTCPTVRDFVARLSADISHPLQANAYLTPPGGVGLNPHADRHDVFVLQTDGSKHWTVEGLPSPFELGRGDVLYIPAGTEHSASGSDVASLHLTVGILRVNYRTVVDRLLRDGPEILDRPLPLRYRSTDRSTDRVDQHEADDLVTTTESALLAAIEHLRAADARLVADNERRRPARRPPAPGRVRAAVASTSLRLDDLLVPSARHWRVETADDVVRVVTDEGWLSAPLACRSALEGIAPSTPIRVRDLSGLDEPSRLILARRLVGAGLCDVEPALRSDTP